VQKERQERKRVRKLLKTLNQGDGRGNGSPKLRKHRAHPGGNADLYKNKWLTGKAIRKTMKTKGRQKTWLANKVRCVVHYVAIFHVLSANTVRGWRAIRGK
jgi:hypothetical protein